MVLAAGRAVCVRPTADTSGNAGTTEEAENGWDRIVRYGAVRFMEQDAETVEEVGIGEELEVYTVNVNSSWRCTPGRWNDGIYPQ